MNTFVVNLLAGSGAGKSTNASRLYTMLKDDGVSVELVTEWCKEAVWEDRKKVFDCQVYIFGNQLYKQKILIGEVDVIITDSPLILSVLYDRKKDINFRKYVVEEFISFNNINFFLERTKPFCQKGRFETEKEAIYKDNQLLHLLKEEDIHFLKTTADVDGCETIFKSIMSILRVGGI